LFIHAGLCRSSWEKSSGIPAPGAHEYVDVTVGTSTSSFRYLVEVGLSTEFDIARPSAAYWDLLRSLPPVFVARPDAFEQVAAAMCAAAADSICGAGMHLAPWRRARYVQAMWSANYERVPVTPVAAAGTRQEAVTPVALARYAVTPARPEGQEAGKQAVVHARRLGGRKNCGMGERIGCARRYGVHAVHIESQLFIFNSTTTPVLHLRPPTTTSKLH
jgi:uncharacterized protein (TIGR01615 family)